MKNIETIAMENKEYLVVSKANFDNNSYGYLINTNDVNDIVFVYFKDDETLRKVEDDNLIKLLVPIFFKNQDFV